MTRDEEWAIRGDNGHIQRKNSSDHAHGGSYSSARYDHECEMDVEDLEGIEDDGDRYDLSEDALDAHRQVLEMSATIQILTRDFESVQKELLEAYKKLNEYATRDTSVSGNSRENDSTQVSPIKALGTSSTGGLGSGAMAKLRSKKFNECGCSHEVELEDFKKMLAVKDSALKEALSERNEYKLELEKVRQSMKDVREHSSSPPQNKSRSSHYNQQSGLPRTASFAGMNMSMTSTSPTRVDLSSSSSSCTMTKNSASTRDLPKRERFDEESRYHRKEDDELFWRKQYRDAVRMRKRPDQQISTTGEHDNSNGSARPSLKIFSCPTSYRYSKKKSDENVPFTRYIGISARQHEIIKEQHRMFS